ncbi:helix-turn-helix domain-containing protein [Corynebacterium sanguinis]|uniref:helix-turn-helix domain-containing protein n=1 Tax=Corynebacterium sanguinis TaxID=2594913 RepID=UPI0021A678F2|nr:helix-turn-helix transcriptional regulator [Corynebacterium sanguinis]MCT1463372.1 helix-turn-helix domain-containing protein [Corynebacterium sanguinis]MCT2329982.1 helix-turn-helix domain-containing protein [Corynebacterium sanguinis]
MNTEKRPTVDTFGKAVARLLSARRAHQGITQQQLSAGTGISQSQLSKQLRGLRAIDLDDLDAICSTLNIEMSALIDAAERELRGSNVIHSIGPSKRTAYRTSDVAPMPYAADTRQPEPEEGDDDYGGGA